MSLSVVGMMGVLLGLIQGVHFKWVRLPFIQTVFLITVSIDYNIKVIIAGAMLILLFDGNPDLNFSRDNPSDYVPAFQITPATKELLKDDNLIHRGMDRIPHDKQRI
ncbi:hypothetical protein KZX77_23470 (plasmid) [Escherichia coli]|uniref:hypothetical protein n=1 Tax=Escherichia coli TaxID=562 RepID=UPI001C793948|nr:hypothetical protein [Escherichia coli]QYE13589.1 hypothetical protein KZX77_23470 [Escherichia coli]